MSFGLALEEELMTDKSDTTQPLASERLLRVITKLECSIAALPFDDDSAKVRGLVIRLRAEHRDRHDIRGTARRLISATQHAMARDPWLRLRYATQDRSSLTPAMIVRRNNPDRYRPRWSGEAVIRSA